MIEPPLYPLRAWRLRQTPKMTLDAAAAGVGTVRSTWHDWETGRRKPEDESIQRLYVFTRGEITADSIYFPFGYPDLETRTLPLGSDAPLLDAMDGKSDDQNRDAAAQLQDAA